MSSNRYDSSRQWYAIHTYSGYEDKVADSIRQKINAVDMADKIFDVMVPKEKQIEIKNGQRKVVEKKIFQGYALVEMILTDETWYIVRNTPGVTGFVGSGTAPTPVSEAEITKIKRRVGIDDPKHQIDFKVGEVVSIIDGPFKSFDGTISEIDAQKGKVKVMVSMFGRDTPVELDALQVSKI
jgi:transcription termination/antitermination protein NusG